VVKDYGALEGAKQTLERLAECDVLAHPSLHDSGGWTCLEAMAAARPVVCLDLGGPGTQVTAATGIKLPAHNPDQVIAAMTAHFHTEWNSLLASDPSSPSKLNAPANLTPKQFVTLASLVESETPKPEERPIVARVFLNRLKIGLPMQCDPTVIYALEQAGKYTPPLTGRDLSFDSAYNTYRHSGLPPGPIANPGEASLRAALAPANVDYLYFVADTEGGHLFSSTLAEHNRNVSRYRRLLGQNGAHNPAPANKPHSNP